MKKLLAISFILIFGLGAYAQFDGPRWVKVDENSFVDFDSIDPEPSGVTFLLKSYNKGQYEPVNGKNISYTLAHYEINCEELTYKIGIIDSYDKNDNFVNGDYNRYSLFQPLVQGSAAGIVSQKLCKK